MKNSSVFCAIFVFMLFCASGSLAAGGWVPFSSDPLAVSQPKDASGYPEVSLLTSDANELVFEIGFPGMLTQEVVNEGITYQTLFIPGGGRTSNFGWAELPTFGRFIAVPLEAEPQIEVLEYTAQTLTGYNVYPVQEQPVDKVGAPEPEFVKDEDFYQKNEFYPDRMAFVGEPKIIRGCPVSLFTLFPVQYNPATGELRIYSHMKVRVTFEGGTGVFVDPARRSPYFEPLYENLLLNYSSLGTPSQSGGKGDTGCDFLIITHPDFEAWAESLAAWKNLTGISTWVKSTDEIGPDTTSIRLYIQNAYYTWSPPPSFVLFVGDAEFVPVFYRTTHPYDGYKTGTDLYYITVDGIDFYPDLYAGRISVDSPEEVETVISKIINYQRNPISSPSSFYSNTLIAGFYQDRYSPYGCADRFFLQTSEVVRDFLLSLGYQGERCYTKTSGSNPQYYYYCTIPIPPGLTWDGDADQINTAINNGVFLVNHRDHGSEDGWGDPDYHVGDVNNLANQDRLPVVFSINCETGHFDNETDAAGNQTPSSSIYFCEAFQRKANGGAVGAFGHTRVSWSGLNDELCKGLYDGMFTNFDPSYPNGGSTHPIYSPMFRMGAVLNFGKFWMYDKYYLTGGAGYPWGSDLSTTKATFEMFHYFGDPTMQIWTGFPKSLTVTHPDSIFVGSSEIPVTITYFGEEPVESALVCLMNDEVYQVGYTDAQGQVTLSCSTTAEGILHVTATKHNYRPYKGLITIAQGSFVRGDANGDGSINIADVTFLINYLFENGPAPYPLDAGDADCNGTVDVGDAVYIMNYLFFGGPAPDCS